MSTPQLIDDPSPDVPLPPAQRQKAARTARTRASPSPAGLRTFEDRADAADRPPSPELALLSVPREAGGAHRLNRALRRRSQPRLRLREVPGRAARPRPEPDADLLRRLPRAPRDFQDPRQHARAGARQLPGSLGAH